MLPKPFLVSCITSKEWGDGREAGSKVDSICYCIWLSGQDRSGDLGTNP